MFTEGVEAVRRHVTELTPGQWAMPVCGTWSAEDTVRHLVSVANWYHEWLNRAIAGDVSRPFPGEQIDAYAAAALEDHQHTSGPDATIAFAESANAYLDRAIERWDLPYGFPFGEVTVGLHAAVAAAEWHLHAWDLSLVGLQRHRPARPDRLMIAAGECVAEAQGGVRGALVRTMLPLAARRSPWETMLRRSGRG